MQPPVGSSSSFTRGSVRGARFSTFHPNPDHLLLGTIPTMLGTIFNVLGTIPTVLGTMPTVLGTTTTILDTTPTMLGPTPTMPGTTPMPGTIPYHVTWFHSQPPRIPR